MGAPTRQQVLDLGLPPPVAARPPELVEQTVDASGLIFFRSHSLGLDAPVSFRAISSTTLGATPSSLPVPLAEGFTFFARPTSSDAFQVATAPSPAPVIAAFTSPAVGRFSFLVDPSKALDIAIARAWTIVQSDCTAHGGDVSAPLLTDASIALAARFYIAIVCAGDPQKAASYDGLSKLYAEVYAPKLAAFFKGVPVRGATDATADIAENAPVLVDRPRGAFDFQDDAGSWRA